MESEEEEETKAQDGDERCGYGVVDDSLEGGVDGGGGFWVVGLEGVSEFGGCSVKMA